MSSVLQNILNEKKKDLKRMGTNTSINSRNSYYDKGQQNQFKRGSYQKTPNSMATIRGRDNQDQIGKRGSHFSSLGNQQGIQNQQQGITRQVWNAEQKQRIEAIHGTTDVFINASKDEKDTKTIIMKECKT